MKTLRFALAALTLAAGATLAVAQMDHSGHDMGGHNMPGHDMSSMAAPKGDTGPSSTAFAAANAEMHAAMDITYTGDADVDFVRGMIAHHEGAIAMAKIQLDFGKDEKIRALSAAIIKAQEAEVADMRAWLAARGLN